MKNKLLLLGLLMTQIAFAQLETLKDIHSDTTHSLGKFRGKKSTELPKQDTPF